MNLNIRKFDPSTIDNNRVCVFIGKRGTGKSSLVSDILYHHRKIPIGVCCSATEESNDFYKAIIPDLYIYNEYKKDVIEQIIKRQRKCVRKKIPNSECFILLDDCMYDKTLTKCPNMRKIFMNGRHWGIFFMLTMQYCMDLSPDLRSNIDYVFILRENIIQNRERIYKNFFGVFPSYDAFSEVMNQCTENYECLVLDNTAKGNKIEDCVFWYKAKLGHKFRMGCKELWAHHKKNYNTKHNDSDDDEDYTKLRKKKMPKITVNKRGRKKKEIKV